MADDLSRMKELIESLGQLQDLTRQASLSSVPPIAAQIESQFSRGVDPYGRPWAPLKPSTLKKGRHPPPLTASGSMRRGVELRPLLGRETGVSVDIPAEQAGFIQSGTRNMAARPMLPDAGPSIQWDEIIASAVTAELKWRLP